MPYLRPRFLIRPARAMRLSVELAVRGLQSSASLTSFGVIAYGDGIREDLRIAAGPRTEPRVPY